MTGGYNVAFGCWAKACNRPVDEAADYDVSCVMAGSPSPYLLWKAQQVDQFRLDTGYEGPINASDDFDEWLCAKYAPNGFE